VISDRDRHDWGWGTWLGMGLMMTVLTVLVVAAAVLVVRATIGPQKTATSLPPWTPRDAPRDSATARRSGCCSMSGSLATTSTKASTSPALTARRTPVTHTPVGGLLGRW